jgi:hypothetical protein
MDFANAFPWKSEMILNFWKWIFNFYKCISKNFGNRFAICANGFPRFWKWIFNFWKCISKILEMDFQFGDEFQCIFLNLSNEFLIKKLYNFNNFYIFIKNSWLFFGFCIELLPQNIDD